MQHFFGGVFLVGVSGSVPLSYDVRTQYPRCRAFAEIFDQETCSSCCAAAVATQLSLRKCISDDDYDTVFSAQQIWDCASLSGTCATGVVLDAMIEAIGVGSRSSRALVDKRYGLPFVPLDPNISQCSNHTQQQERVGGVARYDLAPYYVGIDYASQLASRALMNEIYDNGPVVAVLTFVSNTDFDNFASPTFLKDDHVFMPNVTTWSFLKRHCVVVVGWGIDSVSGHSYWLVQNSYGPTWGNKGFARILRGADLLEGEWLGLFLTPCSPTTTTNKTLPLRVYYEPQETMLLPSSDIVLITFFSGLLAAGLIVALSQRLHWPRPLY